MKTDFDRWFANLHGLPNAVEREVLEIKIAALEQKLIDLKSQLKYENDKLMLYKGAFCAYNASKLKWKIK